MTTLKHGYNHASDCHTEPERNEDNRFVRGIEKKLSLVGSGFEVLTVVTVPAVGVTKVIVEVSMVVANVLGQHSGC